MCGRRKRTAVGITTIQRGIAVADRTKLVRLNNGMATRRAVSGIATANKSWVRSPVVHSPRVIEATISGNNTTTAGPARRATPAARTDEESISSPPTFFEEVRSITERTLAQSVQSRNWHNAVMRQTSFAGMHCSLAQSLEIVGDWWSPLILRDLFAGIARFEDLAKDLGVSRSLLTLRLEHLVERGVVERRRYSERPPRDRYAL